MNLNGEKKKSTTILNGKPCYGYDVEKETRYQNHKKDHVEWTDSWRKDSSKKEMDSKIIVYVVALIIILVVFLICAFMIFVL